VTGKTLDYNNVGAFASPSALDVYSNNMFRLYQLFLDQRINQTDILLGIYDLQTQFAHTQPTELFLNRAFGLTTPLFITGDGAGFNGPSSYPNTTLGMRVKQEINDQWTAKFGLLNGLADNPAAPTSSQIIINSKTGVLAIGEVDYTPFAKTKLMAGYWGYTGKFTGYELNPNYTQHQSYGTGGGYVGGATRIYTIEGSRAVDAFINVGAGASAHSAADRSLNAGLTVTGLYAGRPQDKLGFAFNVLHVSTPFRDLLTLQGAKLSQYEGAFELTYRATINDWLVVQPDVQYIINPVIADIGKNGKNAFVFGLHFELSKLFDLL
jgi:porin